MDKKLIRKMLTAAGGGLVYDDGKNIERTNYNNWSKLSFTDKMKRRFNIAKHLFNESSSPIINSVSAIFGEYDPENPDLNTGVVYAPSRGINPKTVLNVAKGVRTLEDYLKTTKVSAPVLEGSSMARNSYATDRFIGGRLFLNTLPEEAMKILGHGMAKSPTILDALARLRYILDNGIKGKFYTAPLKVSKEAATAGGAIGTGGATPYFDGHFLITGKPGLMINSVDDIGTVYINDAYENEEALKAALKLLQYLLLTYPKINFKLYSLGFKQGGKMNILEFLKNGSGIHIKEKNKGKFTKSAKAAGLSVQEHAKSVLNDPNATPLQKRRANFARNAAKWHHKNGGTIKALGGTKFLSKQWFKNAGNDLKDLFLSEGMLDLGKSLFSGISDYKQTSSLLDGYLNKIAANADLQYEQALMDAEIERQKTPDMFTNTTGEVINQGVETVANGWLPFSLKVTAAKRKLDLLNAAVDLLIRDAKGQALGNMFGTFVLSGLGTLTNILG